MIKLLIGGSPCTHWSIAQHNGREKEASGIGWELFKCYLTAKAKFQPDYFLYENNKSAAPAIKDQISAELGAPLHYINSALVSAQNRQRFYVHNFGDIGQPEDRGIVLDDILDSSEGETFYKLEHVAKGARCVASRGRYKEDGTIGQHLEVRTDGKTNTLTTVQKDNYVAQPIRLGDIQTTAQAHRVYSPYGKSVNLTANGGGQGAKTGLYMCPIDLAKYTLEPDSYHVVAGGQIETRYGVQDINLPDGAYVIRKLKPVECERLQTMPDGYTEGVKDSQRYKALGNGWTAEVIKFILSHIPADKNEPIVVLSMFDGIATGRYVLDALGFTNVKYYAYEIDEGAKAIAMKNYPDIIQLGDAFDVLRDDWTLPEIEVKPAQKMPSKVRVRKLSRTTHELKTLPEYFTAVLSGVKTFEVRRDDRPYKPGDVLMLREYDGAEYTGRTCGADVLYVLRGEYCRDGYCIMSIKPRRVTT